MEKIYDLVYKSGPGGDQCTTYDIKFKKDKITVREFIQNVIEWNPSEWGEFYIYWIDPVLRDCPYAGSTEKYTHVEMDYKWGNFLGSNGHPELLNKYIDVNANNWSNGGWSAMSYTIFLKDEN